MRNWLVFVEQQTANSATSLSAKAASGRGTYPELSVARDKRGREPQPGTRYEPRN